MKRARLNSRGIVGFFMTWSGWVKLENGVLLVGIHRITSKSKTGKANRLLATP